MGALSDSEHVGVEPQFVTGFAISNDSANFYISLNRVVFELAQKAPGSMTGSARHIGMFALSPELAKDLHKVLGKVLLEYEEKQGTIPSIKPLE